MAGAQFVREGVPHGGSPSSSSWARMASGSVAAGRLRPQAAVCASIGTRWTPFPERLQMAFRHQVASL
jgi:hypothetical protein